MKDEIKKCKEACLTVKALCESLWWALHSIEGEIGLCNEQVKTESKALSEDTIKIREYAIEITKLVAEIQKQAWREYAKEEK